MSHHFHNGHRSDGDAGKVVRVLHPWTGEAKGLEGGGVAGVEAGISVVVVVVGIGVGSECGTGSSGIGGGSGGRVIGGGRGGGCHGRCVGGWVFVLLGSRVGTASAVARCRRSGHGNIREYCQEIFGGRK